jgi:hypothetical protein
MGLNIKHTVELFAIHLGVTLQANTTQACPISIALRGIQSHLTLNLTIEVSFVFSPRPTLELWYNSAQYNTHSLRIGSATASTQQDLKKAPLLNCTRVTYNKAIGFSLPVLLLILPSEVFGPSRVMQHDVMHKLLIQGGKIGPIKFYTCVRAKHSYTCSCWQQFSL